MIQLDYVGQSICVVHLEGEVDLNVVPEIRREILKALNRACTQVVLDLGAVTYVDSSMVGLLVWLNKRLETDGGRVVLAGANRDINRVLEVSGLLSYAASVVASPAVDSALEGLRLTRLPGKALWTSRFTSPARADLLRSMRKRVEALLARADMGEAARFDLKAATGEALANAVRHGSPRGPDDEVAVEVSAYPDRVVVTVADQGAGIGARRREPADDSGRGLKVMRALADAVELSPGEDGGTVVALTKHLLPAGRAARGRKA